jgi:uncharacterized membrane protein YfcA
LILLVLTLVVFVVGALIGGVGIGGVLLVPALKYLGGIPLHVAIPACMMAYIVTGLVGAIIYARHGSINWPLAVKVCLGALPGAYFGAFLLPFLPALMLESTIGLLVLVAGIYALRNHGNQFETGASSSDFEMVVIGTITGIGSALTGTGGPLLLIPILIWRKQPVLTAIGLSQAIQVPISLTATLGNFIHAEVDLRLAAALALVLAVGALLGAKTVHLLPIDMIKKVVAVLLISVGFMILLRLVVQL